MSELTPAKTIPVQGWMTAQVMDVLNADGLNALFVGGCVRNALLGEDVGDIDIATKYLPKQVMEMLTAAGIKVVPTGIEHGTVTAVIDGKPFEITTLRKDVETDGRRAVIAFAERWEDDAERRDFTMNTLLADTDGNIYDPTGQGLEHLENRQVIFVGDPATRIAEDVLRVLRFFRFHAMYGQGAPDEAGLKACAAAADKIETLSRERITQEFFKILSVEQPADILGLMFENKILTEFSFPESQENFFHHFCEFQNRYGLAFIASRLLVLAALKLENIQTMEKFLLLPKVFQKDIEAISKVLALPDLSTDHAVKVAIYKHGRVPTAQALMIELTQDRVMNGYAPTAIDIIQNWDIPNFPVTGEALMAEGLEEGPVLGKKLKELEEEWIADGFKAT